VPNDKDGKFLLAEVCSTPPGNTPQGLCDMVGNVPEMVMDAHADFEPFYQRRERGQMAALPPGTPWRWWVTKGNTYYNSDNWEVWPMTVGSNAPAARMGVMEGRQRMLEAGFRFVRDTAP